MTRIAPVKLAHQCRVLWFDARDLNLEKDQPVVVLTARGVEFGYMASAVFEATDEQIAALKSPLKPVKRAATEEDIAQAVAMEQLGQEALPVFRELAAEYGDEMRPISVEYLLTGDKATFYFESDDRVDFRDLVRKLAAQLRIRIDMRQIGVRDEARMVGGLGSCGQELCCKRLGGDFNLVSIRMAKEQDLSLNPQKISGVCGRLMCCLRYEYEAYKDCKSRCPKNNAVIQTPEGEARVASIDVPREVITVRFEDGKQVKVPLKDMDLPEEGARPSSVGEEAWERAQAPESIVGLAESSFLTSKFTGEDKLGEAKAIHTEQSGKLWRQEDSSPESSMSKPLSEEGTARKRRRRSTKLTADGRSIKVEEDAKSDSATSVSNLAENQQTASGEDAPKIGGEDTTKSSASRQRARRRSSQQCRQKNQQDGQQKQEGARQEKDPQQKARKQSGQQNRPKQVSEKQAGQGGALKANGQNHPNERRRRSRPQKRQEGVKPAPRPGQKSSSLQRHASEADASEQRENASSREAKRRRSRHRSHSGSSTENRPDTGGSE